MSHQLFPPNLSLLGESPPGNALAAPPASFLDATSTRVTQANQHSPDDGEGGKLLEVKGEVETEARFEEGGDGFCRNRKSGESEERRFCN